MSPTEEQAGVFTVQPNAAFDIQSIVVKAQCLSHIVTTAAHASRQAHAMHTLQANSMQSSFQEKGFGQRKQTYGTHWEFQFKLLGHTRHKPLKSQADLQGDIHSELSIESDRSPRITSMASLVPILV